jgi:hypothetical protein
VDDAQHVLVDFDVGRQDAGVVAPVIAHGAGVHVVAGSAAQLRLVSLLVLLDVALADVDVRAVAALEHFVKFRPPRHPRQRNVQQRNRGRVRQTGDRVGILAQVGVAFCCWMRPRRPRKANRPRWAWANDLQQRPPSLRRPPF